MAPARLPFWLPIVASTLSNSHLAHRLDGLTAHKVAVLRTKFGLSDFKHIPKGALDVDWLQLLGQLEDEVLAKLVSDRYSVTITPPLIEDIRRDLGISAYTSRKPKLEPHIRELVGRYTSTNIAKGWDVSVLAVEAFRLLAKIEVPAEDQCELPEAGRWKQEWIDLFPQHSNTQIARATGIPIDRVRAKRKILRIASPVKRTYWKVVGVDELDGMTDEELATKYGGPTADYSAQRLALQLKDKPLARQIVEMRQLPLELMVFLSQMSVRRLATLTGLSEFQIRRQLRVHGITPYSPINAKLDALLGTRPDVAIAKTFHVAVSTVKSRRDKLGIPAFKSQNRRSAH